MEYLGPLQLWTATWIILACYVAAETKITPEMPNMLELRPFVLYFGKEESLRTTAYVFLRGFSKSTLEIHRLDATWDRLLISTCVAIIYALIPGITRSLSDRRFWPSDLLHFVIAVSAFVTNLLLVFVLTLVLQMQLMSGLQNYVEWMDDVTSLLDPEFAVQRQLPYLSLFRQSNALSWVEMRSYLYAKGLTIASRQEIFVGALVCIDMAMACYLFYRLISGKSQNSSQLNQSETYNGILFLFFVIIYSLLRMLRITGMLERIQTKQTALLNNQKIKVYYRRVAWVEEKDTPEDETNDIVTDSDDVQRSKMNTISAINADNSNTGLSSSTSTLLASLDGPGYTDDSAENFAASEIQNARYLKKSEALINHIISTVTSHDVSPQVFNMPLQVFIALAVIAVFFAVLPSGIKVYVQKLKNCAYLFKLLAINKKSSPYINNNKNNHSSGVSFFFVNVIFSCKEKKRVKIITIRTEHIGKVLKCNYMKWIYKIKKCKNTLLINFHLQS
ncbi:hypothetical protein RFI_25074 [Reticulomyxa filosa]|uniref:Uncharacterized protein n=1 Tax=Reticulomyxa filosa TaxID=46433 RepID=X6MEG6_RETFI|nr:hypothetical protein RFI_25074 [Reticulomyxa filosa]|eukprot:ETO12304.1 hypothetical protein RFI_25074 [Reticulomyxa filosa]